MALQPLLPADPATVGPHRLLGRLGQGGMGTVYLAVTPDDRAVAVKVLRDGPPDAEGRRRFRRELEVLQRVRGPHLVEVLGGDALAPTPWIVTRFVPGQRLDEVVATGGPLEEDALVRVALGVAEALLALHTAGVVHRDLTPGNVLLVDGEPHVIDLGLAAVADVTVLTRSGLVLGTAGYLAPEQVMGLAVGPAADVHAWGATLALAGTGRPPYGTGRPEAVLYRVVHTDPDLEGLPDALAGLVRAALAKEPAARPELHDVVGRLRALAARDLVGVSSGPQAVLGLADRQVTEVLGRVAAPEDRQVTEVLAPDRQVTEVLARPERQDTQVLGLPAPTLGSDLSATVRTDVHDRHDRRDTAALPVVPGPPAPTSPGAPRAHPVPLPPPPPAGPPEPPAPGRAAVTVPALALLGVSALLAPVLAMVGVLGAVLGLQAFASAEQRRGRLVEQRGPRRRDPVVALLSAPVRLLDAAIDVLLTVPLLLAGAVLPAYVVLALTPQRGPALGTAVGTVLAACLLLSRRRFRGARGVLRRGAALAAPNGPDAALLGGALLAATLALALAALTGAHWWPVTAPPSGCLPVLTCS